MRGNAFVHVNAWPCSFRVRHDTHNAKLRMKSITIGGREMIARSLGLIILLAVCSAEASARCSVPRIHTFNNQAVDGHMTVNSGARCSIKLKHSAGPTYGAHIVQCASNGTVTVDGRNRIVYRSRAGYVGSDSFTYARTGESRVGEAVARTVRISVTVTP